MATHLKRGENFNSNITANCRQRVTVKNIKIGRSLANIWMNVWRHVFYGRRCTIVTITTIIAILVLKFSIDVFRRLHNYAYSGCICSIEVAVLATYLISGA